MYTLLTLVIPLSGLVGLALAYFMYASILQLPDGNDRMRAISASIREGALAYLRKQFSYLLPFILVVFLLICWRLGFTNGIAYVFGSLASLLAGYLGMKSATISNVRTAQAASENKPAEALMVAFNGGSVMGLSVASLGVLGLGVLFFLFGTPEKWEIMVSFGMGASSVALFARVGGGIYTKAADVGADLVGKVEAGIPEDDPRNPGVIADNVGDNVGDVAGMGADIFESFVACIIGCIALGATASPQVLARLTDYGSTSITAQQATIWLMLAPVAIGFLGAIASFVALKSIHLFKHGDPAIALRMVTLVASLVFVVLALGLFWLTPINALLWWSVIFGTACGVGIGLVTEFYTGGKPVYEIIEGAKTGPATNIISGLAVGLRSCALPLFIIVLAIGLSNWFGGGAFGVALAGVAMLSTVGTIMTIDAYGPIADNAGGISEMSELGKETRAITDKLDALGNTTAAIGKGFAIGSAGLTALSLFAAYSQVVQQEMAAHKEVLDLSITNPMLTIGVFIGAILPCLITALTMKSVGRAAGMIVTEIRRQFREIPGLLEGKEGVKPEVGKCVAISTQAALTEMRLPGIIAIVVPVLTGFILGPAALGGLLLGTTVVGVVLGMFMANSGGAWDNAKKFIEQGLVEGEKKSSPAHKAAVVGDTVGDPFKDTSGPSLNILIKLVSMLALLIAPVIA